jgi:CO/xanthine dehydrogenase Mo-binding subunit
MANKVREGFQRARGIIGQPLTRTEDARFLTGAGRFTDDLQLEAQAYAAMVRSPHAHAHIERISIQQAQKMPGVLGIFTGAGPPAGRSLFYGPDLLLPVAAALEPDAPTNGRASSAPPAPLWISIGAGEDGGRLCLRDADFSRARRWREWD